MNFFSAFTKKTFALCCSPIGLPERRSFTRHHVTCFTDNGSLMSRSSCFASYPVLMHSRLKRMSYVAEVPEATISNILRWRRHYERRKSRSSPMRSPISLQLPMPDVCCNWVKILRCLFVMLL